MGNGADRLASDMRGQGDLAMNIVISANTDLAWILFNAYVRARDRLAGTVKCIPKARETDLAETARLLREEAPRISRLFEIEADGTFRIHQANNYENIGRFLRRFYRQAKRLTVKPWRAEGPSTRYFWGEVAKQFIFVMFFRVVHT